LRSIAAWRYSTGTPLPSLNRQGSILATVRAVPASPGGNFLDSYFLNVAGYNDLMLMSSMRGCELQVRVDPSTDALYSVINSELVPQRL
jgi:hypothetical protein